MLAGTLRLGESLTVEGGSWRDRRWCVVQRGGVEKITTGGEYGNRVGSAAHSLVHEKELHAAACLGK